MRHTPEMTDTLQQVLDTPGCERLRDFASVGPAQKAALELFVDRICAAEREARCRWIETMFASYERADNIVAAIRAAERERVTFEMVNEAQRAVQEAVAAEREACARECEDVDANPHVVMHHAIVCAESIRARGQK